MSGVRRKSRSVLSSLESVLDEEEEPKQKDSRLESAQVSRTRRSSRSRITDYFPHASIPSELIDDIIQDDEDQIFMLHPSQEMERDALQTPQTQEQGEEEDEDDDGVPSEGGSSSGKENDLHSNSDAMDKPSFVSGRKEKNAMVMSTRSKTQMNKMPLTTFAHNVSPPPSPSKQGTSPHPASSPPTPHKITLMSKPAFNNLKISLTPKKSIESSTPRLEGPEETHPSLLNSSNHHNLHLAMNNSGLAKEFSVPTKDSEHAMVKKQNSKKKRNTVISTKKRSTPTTPLKKPSTAKKNTSSDNHGSHKVTEYFPIRRSSRKSKKELDKQYTAELEEILRNSNDDHLDLGIAYYSLKGRGVQAMRNFSKGEFVVEYAGDLVEIDIAKEREFQYSKDHSTGCYMYYFKHNGKQYCVDATKDTGRLGRLVNHSRLHPNLLTKVVIFENKPRLILVARQDIEQYSELLYDYGDRSKESLLAHPWLAL